MVLRTRKPLPTLAKDYYRPSGRGRNLRVSATQFLERLPPLTRPSPLPAHPDTRQSLPGAPAQAASPFSLPSARFFWLLDVWVRAGGRDQTRKKQPKVIQTPEHNPFHRPRTLSLCRVSRGSAQANADSLTKVMRNRRGLLMRPIPVRTLTNEERKERLGLSQRF